MSAHKRGNNEGSIVKKKNGRWRAFVTIDNTRLSKTFNTRQECQDWIRKQSNLKDHGFSPRTGKIKLKEYLNEWLDRREKELKPNTAKQYRSNIESLVIPNIGEKTLQELNLSFIDKFYRYLIDRGVGTRSVRYTHQILHKAFEDAVRYDYLLKNPAHGASLPRTVQKEMMILDENQVSQFLLAARTSLYEALFHLAIVTGMRQGELFGLRWGDIQWNRGVLHVQRQTVYVKGEGVIFDTPKTLAGRRTIMIGENTLQALRLHKDRQKIDRAVAGSRWQEDDLVFTSSIGTSLNRSNVRKEYKRILQLANLPDIRFHDLRHTAASIMLNNNVPITVVSRMLGHSKPSVTLDIYSHVITSMQEIAARVMDDLVTPVQIDFDQPAEQKMVENIVRNS